MLSFAKLIDGAFVFGDLTEEGNILNVVKVDLLITNTGMHLINITPYMPFKNDLFPTISKDKIMVSYTINNTEYIELVENYQKRMQILMPNLSKLN